MASPTKPDTKVALVTGAGRGIGAATAAALAASGVDVVVHYNSDAESADAVVRRIRDAGGRAVRIQADLGAPHGHEQLWHEYDRAIKSFGIGEGVDILVNNAGVNHRGSIDETDIAAFDRNVAVNQRAPFFVTQYALPRMRDGGRIINISSGAARYASPHIISYAMTKGALEVFTRSLAAQCGARAITVNAVAPSALDTAMNASWLRASIGARHTAAASTALGVLATPDDIAAIVTFLASPSASTITGQVIDATNGNRL
jgi:3-oxoacyl-[acyl-carrier protein] reductase